MHKIVTPYHGLPGKGSALRTVFKIAESVEAKACVVVDADLRSITPHWVEWLLGPVLHEEFDYLAPRLLDALLIITLGWALARVLKALVHRALVAAKFDPLCGNNGVSQLFRCADLQITPSELSGRCVFWTVWLIFLMSAASGKRQNRTA